MTTEKKSDEQRARELVAALNERCEHSPESPDDFKAFELSAIVAALQAVRAEQSAELAIRLVPPRGTVVRHEHGAEGRVTEFRETDVVLVQADGTELRWPPGDFFEGLVSVVKFDHSRDAELALDRAIVEAAERWVDWIAEESRAELREEDPALDHEAALLQAIEAKRASNPQATSEKPSVEVGAPVRVRPGSSGAEWWVGRESVVTEVFGEADIRIKDIGGLSEQSGPWSARELELIKPSVETKACPECKGLGKYQTGHGWGGRTHSCEPCGGTGRIPTDGTGRKA